MTSDRRWLREKLIELHGIRSAKETVRNILVARRNLVGAATSAFREPHQPRFRRECLGELVQIDGCEHHWFEDRGPYCTLLVYVDDATGQLMELLFVRDRVGLRVLRRHRLYLRRHGKPVAFYSDKHSIFRVDPDGGHGAHAVSPSSAGPWPSSTSTSSAPTRPRPRVGSSE